MRQEIEVRLTAALLEVFHRGERVASHLRDRRKYGFTTLPEHMPPGHRAFAEQDAEWVLQQARGIGPHTEELFRQICAARAHPARGYRSCLGILRPGELHGPDRLERASQRALCTGGLSYRSVQATLQHRLEDTPVPEPLGPTEPLHHANVRGAGYYQPQENTHPC